jgi:glutathione S-transferase
MLTVHHAPNSRSVRAIWLMEELGLDYDIKFYNLKDLGRNEPGYRKVHPMGRVPAVQDGDVTIFESGAIVEYVLARHGGGKMRPAADDAEFANYLTWLHYAEGMLMPPVNTIMVETFFLPPERRNEVNVKRATKLLGNMLSAVDAHMAGREYLAGDFSGADIMTGHACTVARRLGADVSDKPNVAAYIDRINARPAFQKALAAAPS